MAKVDRTQMERTDLEKEKGPARIVLCGSYETATSAMLPSAERSV
jgi:hypothetical protein